MKQSWFRYLGVFDLLLVAAFLGFFGLAALSSSLVIPAMLLAGVAAILGGSVTRITLGPVELSWRYFVGITYTLFAIILPANYLPHVLAGTAGPEEWLLFVAGSLGGVTLLFYGVDVVRGGHHFEVDPDVDRIVGW